MKREQGQNLFAAFRRLGPTLLKAATLGVLASSLVVMSGCPKPPPPPPPAPPPAPPPPPPPAEIALDTLAQELKVDPRVQFRPEMTLTEDRVELGKAVIRLADALARGDANAIKPMLTRKGQDVLNELNANGGWEEGTKKIEAVRVVLIRDGVNISGVGQSSMSSSLTPAMQEVLSKLPEEQREQVKKMLDSLPKDAALMKEGMAQGIDAMKAAGMPDEAVSQVRTLLDSLGDSSADAPQSASSGTATGVLFAIQEQGSSYLLGWAAERMGETYVFTNAPSSPELRPRASGFDSIGPDGFLAVKLQAVVKDPASTPKSDDPASTPSDSGGGGGGGGKRGRAPGEGG